MDFNPSIPQRNQVGSVERKGFGEINITDCQINHLSKYRFKRNVRAAQRGSVD